MQTVRPSPLLKTALAADALACGISAIGQLVLARQMSNLLSLPHNLLVNTGVFLVFYAGLLALMARSERVPSALIVLVVIGNIAWAAGCVGLLASGDVSSTLGVPFMIAQILAVVAFAALEFAGLRRSQPAPFLRAATPR